MRPLNLLIFCLALLWIGLLLFLALNGSQNLKAASVEGHLWFFTLILCTVLAATIFVDLHRNKVNSALLEYNPQKPGAFTYNTLILKPGLTAWILSAFFSVLIYLIVAWLIYDFNLSNMDDATRYGFGSWWLYFAYSFICTAIAVVITINITKLIANKSNRGVGNV